MKKIEFFSTCLPVITMNAVNWVLKPVCTCKFLPHRLYCKAFAHLNTPEEAKGGWVSFRQVALTACWVPLALTGITGFRSICRGKF